MSSELFEALNLLEKERGIQVDFMVDKITKAILTAKIGCLWHKKDNAII